MASIKPEDSAVAAEDVGSVEAPEQTKERAMRQIEFYLSDSNLPYDKFLWTIYDKTSTHWIPIKQLAGFNRMRQFQKHGDAWLVEALRSSKALEVDEKGENVRRTAPLVERARESVEARSVYAKGFPDEYPSLQVDLENYFSRFGVINAVRMRRQDDKAFKGSVFCEFSEVESAHRFLDKEDGKPREFKGKELLIMSKSDYIKMKCEEKGIKPDSQRGGGGTTGGAAGKNRFNAFKMMKKEGRTDTDPRPEHTEISKQFSIIGQDLRIISKEGGGWKLKNDDDLQYVPGAVVGFQVDGDVRIGALKTSAKSIQDLGTYVINQPGESTGYIVFQRGLTDSEFSTLQSMGDKIDGGAYTWFKLSEDKERPLQRQHVIQSIERMADDEGGSKGGKGGRGGKSGRGGRGAKTGRGGRDNNRNRERDNLKIEIKTAKKADAPAGDDGMDVDPTSGVKRKREDADDEPASPKKARVE